MGGEGPLSEAGRTPGLVRRRAFEGKIEGEPRSGNPGAAPGGEPSGGARRAALTWRIPVEGSGKPLPSPPLVWLPQNWVTSQGKAEEATAVLACCH